MAKYPLPERKPISSDPYGILTAMNRLEKVLYTAVKVIQEQEQNKKDEHLKTDGNNDQDTAI